jgi:hypothetical protein
VSDEPVKVDETGQDSREPPRTSTTIEPTEPAKPSLASMAADVDHKIRDKRTFNAVAGQGHEIAGMYAFAKLDDLIDLARLVSLDFFGHPEYYKTFDNPDVAEDLAQMHAQYGCNEKFLSHEQRQAIFIPLFQDIEGNFLGDRDAILSAAATFSEWGQATGVPMLRAAMESVRDNFMTQLANFEGASLTWSRMHALEPLTEVSYRILREPGVTSVFKVRTPPIEAWPFIDDPNGDQLVENIGKQFDSDKVPAKVPKLSRHDFRLRQRAALRGAEAISAVIDYIPGSDVDTLDRVISRSYTWYAGLQGVTGMGRVTSALSGVTMDGDRRVAGAGSFLPRKP